MKHKHPLCSLTLLGVHEPSYLSIFSLSLATYLNLCTNPPYLSLVWMLMSPHISLSFLSLWLAESPSLWKHTIFLLLSLFGFFECRWTLLHLSNSFSLTIYVTLAIEGCHLSPSLFLLFWVYMNHPISLFLSFSLSGYLHHLTYGRMPSLSISLYLWFVDEPSSIYPFISLWLHPSTCFWKYPILFHLYFFLFWMYMNPPISIFSLSGYLRHLSYGSTPSFSLSLFLAFLRVDEPSIICLILSLWLSMSP